MNKLFEEKIENYDLLQLENWIRRCRNAIKKENFLDTNRSKEECEENYKEAVLNFLEEWKEHYENNKDIYHGETYKKAILASGLKKYDFIFKYKDKSRILNDDNFYNKLLEQYEQNNNVLMHSFSKTRLNSIFEYYNFFERELLDLDKNNYRKTISEWIEYRFSNYSFIIEVDEEDILTKNIDDLIDLLKDTKVKIHFDKQFYKLNKMSLLEELYNFDIAKQPYYDYRDMNIIKDFGKKLILNIGLALSLDYDNYEKLLNIHGFSIENSLELRDILLKEMILTGLGKEYIDIALEDKNIMNIRKRSGLFDKRDNCYNIYYDYNQRLYHGEPINNYMEVQYIKACKTMLKIVNDFLQNLDKKEKQYNSLINKKQKFVSNAPEKLTKLDDEKNNLARKISEVQDKIKIHGREFNDNWIDKEKLGILSDAEFKLLTNHRDFADKLKDELRVLQVEKQKNETKKNNLESRLDKEMEMIDKYKNYIFELKYEGVRSNNPSLKPKKYRVFLYNKINSKYNSLEEDGDKPCDKFSATRQDLENLKNELKKIIKSKEA